MKRPRRGSSFRKKNDQVVDLEFLSIPQKPLFFLAMGHVDICYQGRLFPMARMIPTRSVCSAWLEMVFCLRANREKYIELCKRGSQKTLFAYGLSLTDQQKSHPSSSRRDRRPVNSLGTKFTVDEKEERGRGKSIPTPTN